MAPATSGLAARVRRYREALGLSLTDLAKRSGVSRSYLYQVESGESSPTEEKLLALSTALGVTVSDLLGLDEAQPEIPESLTEFAQRHGIPSADVHMLARINYRGKQPTTPEDWRTLYLVIKATTGEEQE